MDTLDIWQNGMQFRIHYFFSVALVIPHPALSWHLCLCLSAESAALVFPCKQLKLPVDLLSQGFLGNQPWQLLELCPFPGPSRALLPFSGPAVARGGTIFQPLLLHPGSQLLALQASLSQTKPAELPDDIGPFLLSPHKVINERISVVNSLDCFIIYFYFFTIHLSITWNFHWNQQDLQYLFFCLVIQCTVIIQFYCLCLGTSQNECWWNSQLIRDKQSFKKSWTEEELFPTSLTNIN